MNLHDRIAAELMAAFGAVGGLMHNAPIAATVLAAVWYGLQIYDRLSSRSRKRNDP